MKTLFLIAALSFSAQVHAALANPDNRSLTGFGITEDGNLIASSGTFRGPLDVQNGMTVHSGMFVGTDGTKISRAYAADVSLDFGAIAAGACSTLQMTVTGASNGDVVTLGIPQALANADANLVWSGFAQADTVNVRFCCTRLSGSCANPAAATVKALVIRAK